jgi:hypothetical protein
VSPAVDFDDYLEAEVLDQGGKLVANLDCYWTDDDAETLFLGVKTGQSREKTTVVPASLAEANERESCVVLFVFESKLNQAPRLECDEELNPAFEEKVYKHYELTPANAPHLQIHRGRVTP